MGIPITYHPHYVAALPAGHPFPMGKFQRLYEHLLAEGLVHPGDVHRPEPISREALELAHAREYVGGIIDRNLPAAVVRRIGFPLEAPVVRRSRAAVGGTLLAARLALRYGIAFNMAGGSHHAFSTHGAGYCVFNDVGVAVHSLLAEGAVHRVLVVDLDVHQGDGTAEIFSQTPEVFTFSMHCESNFPRVKQCSDRDLGLPDGTGDEVYLTRLESELEQWVPKVRPDLIVYNAGVDPHQDDRLGRLALTDDGLARREQLVLETARRRGVPLVGVMGGGYGRQLEVLVQRHALLHRAAWQTFGGGKASSPQGSPQGSP